MSMIPTMIGFGLLAGRWWKTALVGGAIYWPVLLLSTGVISWGHVGGAAALGLANTAVGVLVHQAVLRTVRAVRRLRHRA